MRAGGLLIMLLLDDHAELPARPDEAEAALEAQLGEQGLSATDEMLKKHTRRRWLKVSRVVADALEASGVPVSNEGYVALYVRRTIALVDAGLFEAQGDLRRPRRSEVRLSDPRAKSD
jgi:hypothetical protein